MSRTKCYYCIYRGNRSGETASCQYILHTGEERRLICDPEDACTVWQRGAPLKLKEPEPLEIPTVTKPKAPARWTRLDEAHALQLYQRGLTDYQIADALGCSRPGVRRWRLRYELPTKWRTE